MLDLVLSHGYFILEDEKEQKIMKPYPPLGILYLSAWLEKHNISHEVYDTTFSKKALFKSYLVEHKPRIIAFYTNLMTKVNVIELIQYIRVEASLKDSIVVLGGPDVRHNIEDYLKVGSDIVVFGEGEQTILEIAQTVLQGNTKEFGHIEGLAYRSEGQVVKTLERVKIKQIDDLPLPNRKKIAMQPYLDAWKQAHGQSAMTISTQRGCPYTCKWCSTAVYGQSYRRRSPELVAAELKMLKADYNPDTIWFVDDVFSVSHKWIEEFRDEVQKQNASIPFECITRADRLNEVVIDMLKEAGCFRIWIGAESGSQRVIDLMDRRVNVDYVSSMIKLTKSKGIEAGTFIMLGYPGETEEDIKKTVEYLKDCKPSQFTITVAYPIKGTSMYQEVEANQVYDKDWNTSTDRDRDFKRTYSRKYYDYAVRWVVSSVNSAIDPSPISKLKLQAKATYHRVNMMLNR